MNRTLYEKLDHETRWLYELAVDRLASGDEDTAGSLFMSWGRLKRLSRTANADAEVGALLQEWIQDEQVKPDHCEQCWAMLRSLRRLLEAPDPDDSEEAANDE